MKEIAVILDDTISPSPFPIVAPATPPEEPGGYECDGGHVPCLTFNPFLASVMDELTSAESKHKPLNSLHEAYAVITEEAFELWLEVIKKREARDQANVRKELVQIATMCWRAARDLGLEEEIVAPPSLPDPCDVL